MARMRSSIVFAASVRMAFLPWFGWRCCHGRLVAPRRSWRCQAAYRRHGAAPAPVGEDRVRGIVAGRAGDAAAGMRAGAAMIEARQRPAVVGIAEHGPRPEQLVERHRAVRDVAADEAEHLFEVERAQRLAADHARLEARRIAVDGVDHQVGDLVAMVVPGAAVGQLRRDVLAEQARDMRALRRQRVVEGRGDDQLDDRLPAPAVLARVADRRGPCSRGSGRSRCRRCGGRRACGPAAR